MGGIGAGGLVPFGGIVPEFAQPDEETRREHAHSSLEDGIEGEQVKGVDPIPASTPPDSARPLDPDLGPVPGAPDPDDPDVPGVPSPPGDGQEGRD